jgi:hypothetical protein
VLQPSPCGCPPAGHARIRLLDGQLGLTFAVGGLIVHGDTWEAMSRQQSDPEFRITGKVQRLISTGSHEYIHYLQAVGSMFLQQLGFAQLQIAVALLNHGPREDLVASFRDSQSALADPADEGLSCLDLLEAAAVLEGYKLDRQDWGVHPESPEAKAGFPEALAEYRADPARRRYHVAFDWLESVLGYEAAYMLFMPLAFVAFNTDDPVPHFVAAARAVDLDAVDLTAPVAALVGRDVWLANPETARELPSHAPPVTRAGFHMVDVFGLDDALELLVRPWRLDRETAPTELKDAVAPLVLAWSSAAGLVEMQLSDLTAPNDGFLDRVLSFVAIIGAAQRLCAAAAGDAAVYRFCPHTTCPHYAPALCHRYYLPPPLERHHDTCGFIGTLERVAHATSAEIWARWSLDE